MCFNPVRSRRNMALLEALNTVHRTVRRHAVQIQQLTAQLSQIQVQLDRSREYVGDGEWKCAAVNIKPSLLLPASLGGISVCVHLMSVRWFRVGCQGFFLNMIFQWQEELFLLFDSRRFSFSSLGKWWIRNMALQCQRSTHNAGSAVAPHCIAPRQVPPRVEIWLFGETTGFFRAPGKIVRVSTSVFPESVWAKGSSKSWICILSHLHIITSSHLHNFTSSHLHIFTSSHHHIFTSSHPHIFTSSHLHILISSHLHIFTSSHPHLHIFTSSHLHIFTSSHPHILTLSLSFSLSLSLSLFLSLSLSLSLSSLSLSPFSLSPSSSFSL